MSLVCDFLPRCGGSLGRDGEGRGSFEREEEEGGAAVMGACGESTGRRGISSANISRLRLAKATDENLTAVNWEFMMDAWEKVNAEPETGAKDAVAALIKRLAHRNANVQLYTLELANAFTQNCGFKMHQEMASRAFTDALLRLAGDRTTHQAVKTSVLEKMQEWVTMFQKDPGLGIMEQAFNKLKSQSMCESRWGRLEVDGDAKADRRLCDRPDSTGTLETA